jgi:hypothetical protein
MTRADLQDADVDQTTRDLIAELRSEIDALRADLPTDETSASIEFQRLLFAELSVVNDRGAVWKELAEFLRNRRSV